MNRFAYDREGKRRMMEHKWMDSFYVPIYLIVSRRVHTFSILLEDKDLNNIVPL